MMILEPRQPGSHCVVCSVSVRLNIIQPFFVYSAASCDELCGMDVDWKFIVGMAPRDKVSRQER